MSELDTDNPGEWPDARNAVLHAIAAHESPDATAIALIGPITPGPITYRVHENHQMRDKLSSITLHLSREDLNMRVHLDGSDRHELAWDGDAHDAPDWVSECTTAHAHVNGARSALEFAEEWNLRPRP